MREFGVLGEDIAKLLGHTSANVSLLKKGKIRSIRFSTLFTLCDFFDRKPGDFLDRIPAEEAENLPKGVYVINMDDDTPCSE
ncbi:transcriptional regulator [Eggerthella lenta]|nr:transcriptional regulator [Eggerthella lenta]